MKKDLFISHAFEDKDDFVRPLANLLKEYGLDVWYDEFELRIGKTLSKSIDIGIKGSNFGLIILSNAFFNKTWTEHELKKLHSYENDNDVLLPIWKDVTAEEVKKFSPYLADKFALPTQSMPIEQIALKIIETVKPSLFSEIHRKIVFEESLKNAKTIKIKANEIKPGPIIHPKLNETTISRIRLIRAALLICYPHSMAFWMDGFKRDLIFEGELIYWEHLASCFTELVSMKSTMDAYKGDGDFCEDLFKLLFFIKDAEIYKKLGFTPQFIKQAIYVWQNTFPIYEIEDNPKEIFGDENGKK